MAAPHVKSDPIKLLLEGHHEVSEWLHNFRVAMDVVERQKTWTELKPLEAFFRRNVREHFMFEETFVFPTLLELDRSPAVQELIAKLRADHVEILAELSKLMQELAEAVAAGMDPDTQGRMKARTHEVLDRLLVHAAHEDDHLLPVLMAHSDELTQAWKEHRRADRQAP